MKYALILSILIHGILFYCFSARSKTTSESILITQIQFEKTTISRKTNASPSSKGTEEANGTMICEFCPEPSYPTDSITKGEKGIVNFTVKFSTLTKQAMKIEIEKSSGFTNLDNAVKEAILKWIVHLKSDIPITEFLVRSSYEFK